MLKPNQLIEVKWSPSNRKHYESLGYVFTKRGDIFLVKAEELMPSSEIRVDVICDNCGKVRSLTNKTFHKQHDEEFGDLCHECCDLKRSRTMMEMYGVANTSQLETTKQKKIDTCMKHFGVEHSLQSPEVKAKSCQTSIEKYGVPYPSQCKEVQNKVKQTNIERYGCECGLNNPEIRAKIQNTCMEKYGAITPLGNADIRAKAEQTCYEHFGVLRPFDSLEILEKARQTLSNNGNVPTSRQQLKVYDMLKNIYGNCELNYSVSLCSLDCMVKVNDAQIDVEYDGWYWHKDKQERDRKRDEFLKLQGYKILRIKAGCKIPTKEQLINAINHLVKDDYSYTEIILDI